jgi:hypothetical protein
MNRFQIYLGDEVVGRSGGYRNHKAAVVAARKIAEEKGSLPFEIRPDHRAPAPRRCAPSLVEGE